jgi:hypothetical protein
LPPIFLDVTAMAMTSDAYAGRSRAAAPAPSAMRALLGSFHEPNMITVSILAVTGIVVAARHPIAHMLGTEVDTPPIGATSVATAPASTPSAPSRASALSLPVPVPTHSPRNPFASLVSSSGQLLASATQSVEQAVNKAVTSAPAKAPAAAVTATSTCAGSMHRVAAGESLWTLAARAVHSKDVGTVNVAWRRIYAANRDVLSNPSIIHVGQNICVPTKLS